MKNTYGAAKAGVMTEAAAATRVSLVETMMNFFWYEKGSRS
jgi:hypothetical protein